MKYPIGYTGGMITTTKFAVLYSLVNGRVTVHVAECRAVKAAECGRAHAITRVSADTAEDAASRFIELTREQGLQEPKICKCAK